MQGLSPAETLAAHEAVRLYRSGREKYDQCRLRETVEQLDRARKLATIGGNPELDAAARFWQGAALHGAGRLTEAFAVWGPALRLEAARPLSPDLYLMLTRYVLAAIELPLAVDVIERVVAEVEARLEASDGARGCRSRMLLARSRLALARGRPQESLQLGLDGLVRCKQEAHTYSYSTHFRTLTRAALLAEQPDLVAELLDDWDRTERAFPDVKRFAIAAARANLARFQGDADEAMRIAGAVVDEATRGEEIGPAAEASLAFARACFAAGSPERARAAVAYLMRFRRAAVGELRFATTLLLGDYHLACALLDAEGRAEDVEFSGAQGVAPTAAARTHQRAPARRSRRTTDGYAVRAARAYAAAEVEGARLDALLATRQRHEIMASRNARLHQRVAHHARSWSPQRRAYE